MQDNSQNNWKSMLENPDSLPGEKIRDKNEAWERLYSRLHNKPQRKLFAWYWVAASFLVIAISAALIFVNKQKHQEITVMVPSPVINQSSIVSESKPGAESKSKTDHLPGRKEETQIANAPTQNKFVKTIHPVNKRLVADSVVKQLPELVTAPGLAFDTIRTIATAVTPKKKLRIVHLNEIGQPTEEPVVNNRVTERRGFELRISTGEIYNPVNGSFSNNGLILTKPRNTSN